jgi:hypothetical protein
MIIRDAYANNPYGIIPSAALKADAKAIAVRNETVAGKDSPVSVDKVTISPEARLAAEKSKADNKTANKSKEDKIQKEAQQEEIDKLSKSDSKVRTHEMLHKSVGGAYAGAVVLKYRTGPDGKQYAVGGYVEMDVSPGKTPQETIKKAQTIKQAALAPSDPSGADRAVAAAAASMAQDARQQELEESQGAGEGGQKTKSPEVASGVKNAQV